MQYNTHQCGKWIITSATIVNVAQTTLGNSKLNEDENKSNRLIVMAFEEEFFMFEISMFNLPTVDCPTV